MIIPCFDHTTIDTSPCVVKTAERLTMDSDERQAPLASHWSILPGSPHEITPSTARLQVWRRQMTSNAWARRLDRVNVLGDEVHGHTG